MDDIRDKIPLRRTVRAILYRCGEEGYEYLVLHKRKKNGVRYWQNPQGGVDEGETEIGALRREIVEETGIEKVRILENTRTEVDYYTEREDKTVHSFVAAYAVESLDHKCVEVSKKEGHEGYRWLSYDLARVHLCLYPEQQSIFEEVCRKAILN